MKIPDSVRIAGIEYPVKFVENLRHGSQICYGHVDYENCLIKISDTDGKEHQHQCVTLWHEIVHTIIDNAELEVPEDKEEMFVTILARGIYQVLQDNGGKLFDLAPEKKLENITDVEMDLRFERVQASQLKSQLDDAKSLLKAINEKCAQTCLGDEAASITASVCALIDEYFDEGEGHE